MYRLWFNLCPHWWTRQKTLEFTARKTDTQIKKKTSGLQVQCKETKKVMWQRQPDGWCAPLDLLFALLHTASGFRRLTFPDCIIGLPCTLASGCVWSMGTIGRGFENWRRMRDGYMFPWILHASPLLMGRDCFSLLRKPLRTFLWSEFQEIFLLLLSHS